MLKLLGVYAQGVVAGGAYESIATATGTGSSGTITFSSIPQTYQHLELRILSRSTANQATSDLILQINGVTASSSYKSHYLGGTGAAAFAGVDGSGTTNAFISLTPGATVSSNINGVAIVDIHDYTSTTKNTTIRAFAGHDQNGATGYVWLSSGMNLSTSAVDSLSILLNTGNFTTSSQFALYGIKGA